MADTKISGLTAGVTAVASDLIPIARSGVNYSLQVSDVLSTSLLAGKINDAALATGSVVKSLEATYERTAAEVSAGVTPTNYGYPPGNVKRYGALGDGVTDDTTAFTNAKASNTYVYVPASTGNYVVAATVNSTGLYGPGTVVAGTVTLLIDSYEKGVSAGDATDVLYRTGVTWPSTLFHDAVPAYNLVILGDSITYGNGAGAYNQAWAYQFVRSLFNAMDVPSRRQTLEYHSAFSMAMALQESGISSTGTLDASGVVGSRLKLTAGQTITVTNRAMDYLDVVYDGAVSSGTLTFALNGTATGRVHTCSGASLNNTFDGSTISNAQRPITEADTVTITASATVYITSILTFKANNTPSPKVFLAGQSGVTYHDFTGASAAAELSYYATIFGSTGDPCVFMLMLGANSMYSVGNNWTPAQTITDLNTLITNIKANRANAKFILGVPYQANEGTWPIKQAGYTYQNYVDSIVAYAKANGHGLIRQDLTDMHNGMHYSDGLHPDATGHNILAQAACSAFGVPMNGFIKTALGATDATIGTITLSGTWASFAGAPYAPRARRLAGTDPNVVMLSGLLSPGAATAVGTLPSGFRPIGRSNIYVLARGDAGPILLTIDNGGGLTVGSIPVTYLSLDGISFLINSF